MDRRDFLKGLGTAALAGAFAGGAARAAEADGEGFCFAVVADPHCAEGPRKGMEALGTGADRFLRCVEAMKALPAAEQPDFVLVLGDLHTDAFLPLVKEVPYPLHVTFGNHESTPEQRKNLRDAFPGDFTVNGEPSDYYSFTHKGARFISLCDAGLGGEHIGTLCSENIRPRGQCEWLEAELSAPEPRKVLFAHIPVERNGGDREMHLNRNDSRWMNALLREKGPDALFFGHLHTPTEEYSNGKSRVWQVRSCCWNGGNAPVGFLLARMTPGGVSCREILTGGGA